MALQSVRRETLNPERQRLYRRAIWITVAGNVLLAGGKGGVAWLSASSAVFSDAANALSDVFYSSLLAVGLYLAQKPADEGHPQGHSRFEPLVSLMVAFAMMVAGGAALGEGIRRFRAGATAIEPGWPTVALVGSGLVKVVMYWLIGRIGRAARSPALRACARDNVSDVLASAGALVGVWGSEIFHPMFDPLAGVLVALWIFRSTWDILSENMGYLTGRGPQPALNDQIMARAASVPGVANVHQVIADHVGPQLRVDMHVDVAGDMGLRQAHSIADRVQERVEALPLVDLAFVHVEPIHAPSEGGARDRLSAQLYQLAEEIGVDIHEVWIYKLDGGYYAEVHAEVEGTLSLQKAHALISSLEERAGEEIAGLVDLTAHIEPRGELVQVPAAGMPESGMADLVRQSTDQVLGAGACHHVHVRRSKAGWSVSLHCRLPGELSLAMAHHTSTRLEAKLRQDIAGLDRVVIHTEPEEA